MDRLKIGVNKRKGVETLYTRSFLANQYPVNVNTAQYTIQEYQ